MKTEDVFDFVWCDLKSKGDLYLQGVRKVVSELWAFNAIKVMQLQN